MKLIKKTIFTGFSPNTSWKDVKIVLIFLLLPWEWKNIVKGHYTERAEILLKKYFKVKNAFVFDSGRSSLFYALKALGVSKGDKILVQAYTCVVVVNAIKQTGAEPIYIDINDDFNMNPDFLNDKLKEAIKAKVLIIQHTFGIPAQLDKLMSVAKKYNLKIIEDCAHSFGVKYNNIFLGKRGDIGMFSFGSDKSISCVRGGGLITKNKEIADNILKLQQNLKEPSLYYVLQHLLQIPVFSIGKLFYSIKIGKVFLFVMKNLGVINKIVYPMEKRGHFAKKHSTKLANSLAKILCHQLNEVDKLNEHRRSISRIYTKNIKNKKIFLPIKNDKLIYLRYVILVKNAKKIHNYMKNKNVILGNWYNSVIVPKDIKLSATGYVSGSCPVAEKLAKYSVNLPTNRNITKADAQYIVKQLNNFN